MSEQNESSENNEQLDPVELRHLRNLVDRNEIRRTYAKLLRRFSPESHPAEFQQIRAAYETAIQSADWHKSATANIDENETRLPSELSSWILRKHSVSPQDPSFERAAESPERPESSKHVYQSVNDHDTELRWKLSNIWREFSSNPSTEQSESLRTLCDDQMTSPESFLMLFWMEKLRPDLGNGTLPFQVLLRAIRRFPTDSRFHQLHRREMTEDLRATTFESLGKVLDAMRDLDQLARCLDLRWSILCERSSWTQLRQELDLLRPGLSNSQRVLWIDLLLTVNEYLVFSSDATGQELLKDISTEVATSFDLQDRFQRRLEKLDILTDICQQRFSYTLSDQLSRLITTRRHSERTSFVQDLFVMVRTWVGAPIEGLNLVSRLSVNFLYAFWQLRSYIQLLPVPPELTADDSPELLLALRSRLQGFCDIEYRLARQHFLNFCRDECIDGQQLLRLLRTAVSSKIRLTRNLAEFERDQSLQVTCFCIQSFLCAS